MARERRVLIPGGTGVVGRGVVRAYLAAGAHVVVPTRSEQRAHLLDDLAGDRLHVVVHDYTTFDGAERLVAGMVERLGGLDDVVAPIGGYWGGRRLWEIDATDWRSAFVDLATTHAAVMRAVVPRLGRDGAYQIIAGESGVRAVPGAGLLSMQQSALLMMREVLAAEAEGRSRVFALVLGSVGTEPNSITADEIGSVAVAVSDSALTGREIRLPDSDAAARALMRLRGPVFAASTMQPRAGRRGDLVEVLSELAPRILAEPGCLHYSVHSTPGEDGGPLLVLMTFASTEEYERHSALISPWIPRLAPLLDGPLVPPRLYDTDPSIGVAADRLVGA